MKRFFKVAAGLFSVEHALMASLVAIVAFASMHILGDDTATSLFRLSNFS
jgi:Flp pilus assembly pilin Flp